MICSKCNQILPDDSEFCQYCGYKLEQVTDITADVSVTSIPEIIAKPNTNSHKTPAPTSKREKTIKRKYCSKCGSLIDNATKKCTGCGKQYFRGIRFTQLSATVTVSVLVIIALFLVCIFQYIDYQKTIERMETRISNMAEEIKDMDSTIKGKDMTIDEKDATIRMLSSKITAIYNELDFFKNHAEIIPDDGTNKYHKWGCSHLDISKGFWIKNTEAANDNYTECPHCH